MFRSIQYEGFLGVAALLAQPLSAQFNFAVDGKEVQVHSFFSQGFAYSDDNNFLTMKTSQGSFAFTDMGLNVSTQLTDKFRVGAEVYDRNVGSLGDWHPVLDWATADYRFKDWFGVRGGKVKTVLGLYTDSQDAAFLHPWVLLPQSVYPSDLRSTYDAHIGADIYGQIPLQRLGSLSYTGYWGQVPFDKYGGFAYTLTDAGLPVTSLSTSMEGFDLHWNTSIPGLAIGVSWANINSNLKGDYLPYHTTYKDPTDPDHLSVGYADFTHDKWHLASEYRRSYEVTDFTLFGAVEKSNSSDQSWFASAAYRAFSKLELGAYYSSYRTDIVAVANAQHIYDPVVTARVDLTKFWVVKVEGHFMDGYGDIYSSHGFYPASNPNGLKPRTNLVLVQTSWYF
jgi:hypothetical protein